MDWSNLRLAALMAASLCMSGCAALVSKAASGFSDNLSSAFLNQDDPETVRAGMPSYMLLIDSFVQGEKPSPAMLSAAANLYASYGAVFTDDEVRASRLTRRARSYSSEAMCLSYADACSWGSKTYDEFVTSLAGVGEKQAKLLYVYAFTMLAYIRAHTSDWNALAELPQAEAVLNRYLELSGSAVNASAYTYLGVLLTLRPPAMGGKPEEARRHFERAIAMSEGRNLSAKVEYAKGYAKTLYQRELHDQLVTDVLTASPYADGFTLMNVLAQEEAAAMLAQADDYF
jgi:tetratricopeptide (TPR) repeat protein